MKRILKYCLWLMYLASLLPGCYDPPPPERVFVPGPEARVAISISVSSTRASVDEPIVLFASRRTSGYVEIGYADLPEGVHWWRQMPSAYEIEVAGNLRWIVRPEGKARFNTDFRKDLTREVRFSEPGAYEIHGLSTGPGPDPVKSETIVIEVRE